jgi:hypothetical protein
VAGIETLKIRAAFACIPPALPIKKKDRQMKLYKKMIFVGLLAGALIPRAIFAAEKTYQVTGQVLEVNATKIIVDKMGEKFELSRTAATKVTGDLKVGEKATIYYTITAVEVEVKGDKAPAKDAKKK